MLNAGTSDGFKPLSEYVIFKLLDNLKPTATGLDELPAWFLRLSAPIFCKPLTILLNASVSQSFVPRQWKSSCIVPIAKIQNSVVLSDYRPIPITPVLSRLTERIVIKTYIYPPLLNPPSDVLL